MAGIAAVYKLLNPGASPSNIHAALLSSAATAEDQCDGNRKVHVVTVNPCIMNLYAGNTTSFSPHI